MGSKRRQEAIAAGLPVENADAARRRRRVAAAIVREEIAITLWARGKTAREISEVLYEQTGARLVGNIPELVRRGLYRRVTEGAENVEETREIFRERYRGLLAAWYPLAVPEHPDVAPDPVAAAQVLRILRDWGVVERIVAPPRSGDINLAVINGVQMTDEDARARAQAGLAREREKQKTIEGVLAGTPATAAVEAEDGKTPPPFLPKRPD